jgi:HEAT repeat protein
LAEGELEVVSPDGRTVPAQPVSASRSVTPPSSVDEARAALVGETITTFEDRVMQLTAPVDEVLARLAGQDAEGRLLAVDRLSIERADIAVPALRQAIRTEASAAARVRMVGALGALGDPRAADDLIALADTRDAELFVAVIDALVQLGGPKAREFFALMSTHDSTEIRALVEDAAIRLERRASMGQRPH